MAGEDDLDLLAGEYVLGTLPPEERQAVERRLLDSPELARRVAAWERHLAPLSQDLPPLTPSPRVWQQLRRSVAAQQPTVPRRGRPSLWSSLGLWRGLAGVATAAALCLAALLLALPPPPPQLLAVLGDGGGRPLWVVRAAAGADDLAAAALGTGPPAPQVPQLWLIPPGGTPISLGLLHAEGVSRHGLAVPKGTRLRQGDTLAVSLEPPGGSPTGLPTGPVVSTGVLVPEPG